MKKILIIDDHEIVRDGLKKIVNEQSENITFGEASTAPEALRLVAEQDWDIVVRTIRAPIVQSRGGRLHNQR